MVQTNTAKGTSVAKGAALMMLLKLTERGIGLGSTLVLARVLTPGDFGLVAMAMSVVAMTELMGAFGFDVAIIQNQNAERKHYDTAWTFNLIFSAVIALLLLLLTVPAARFYHEERLLMVLPILALGAFFTGLENIGTVNFRKHMDFKKEFHFVFMKRFATFLVTMVLALTMRNYWALVIGIISGKLFSTVISYFLHTYRPRLSLAASGEFFHFSKWLFLSTLVLFIQNKADSFILGRAIGTHDLGVYNIANELAMMPSTEFIAPINRATFPAYSKLASNLAELRKKFLEVFSMITTIALPLAVGLACVADTAVAVLLGDQWSEAVPLMRIFAVCGLASALQSNLVMLIVACGHPKANTVRSAMMLVIYLPALVYSAIHYGMYGAAWVHLVMSVIVLLPLHVVFLRLLELKLGTYIGALWRPVAAAMVMALGLILFRNAFDNGLAAWAPLILLMIYVLLGALLYVGAICLLWLASGQPADSAESTMLAAVRLRLLKGKPA